MLLMLNLLLICVGAQTKIQVVKRTISKEISLAKVETVRINGEKANIIIQPTKESSVKVLISLIAKNPKRELAEADVKHCSYSINEDFNRLNIANGFTSGDNFEDISSNLSARIELWLPNNISVEINNIYGSVRISNVNGNYNIVNNFGETDLNNISGKLKLLSNYGDINGVKLKSECSIEAKKSEIEIDGIESVCTIKNQYGKVNIHSLNAPITILCENTEIIFNVEKAERYSLDLSTLNGKIDFLGIFKNGSFIQKNGEIHIKAHTTNSKITLKTVQ